MDKWTFQMDKIKSLPTFFLLQKPFHSDIHHNILGKKRLCYHKICYMVTLKKEKYKSHLLYRLSVILTLICYAMFVITGMLSLTDISSVLLYYNKPKLTFCICVYLLIILNQ